MIFFTITTFNPEEREACRSAPVRWACVSGRIAGKRVLYAAFSFSEPLTNEEHGKP
jgi:hypothetical protein